MKRGQVIALALAGACGLGAVMIANSFMQTPAPQRNVEIGEKLETMQVLVARSDIGLGQVAADSSFRWQEWPKEAITRGFITKQAKPQAIAELSGTFARLPITAGEPINEQKLVRAGSGGVLAAILRPGMRAVSVRIKEETAAGRLILPNDHVDVLQVRRVRTKNGQEDLVTDTLLGNIRVLAIGQTIETRDGKRTVEGATATLELTPGHAERLAQASNAGDIVLSLRSVADIAEVAAEEKGARKAGASEQIQVIRYGVKSRVSVAP